MPHLYTGIVAYHWQFFPDVLVRSTRPAPDLHTDEFIELIRTMQRVGRVCERAHKADKLIIAYLAPPHLSSLSSFFPQLMSDGRDLSDG